MNRISYESSGLSVPDRYAAAHTRFWNRLAAAGTWLTGEQRVAIAAEVRGAWACELCRHRRDALSPTHVDGDHDRATDLPETMLEIVHRVTTDPGRLTKAWFLQCLDGGLDEETYVEILGTVVSVFSIDEFCRGIGVDLHPLPEPVPGEPRRYRPSAAQHSDAWVSMIPQRAARGQEADLWKVGETGNVIRAMSLVPDEVRTLNDLSDAHYVPDGTFMSFRGRPHGTLTRTQMEVIAGRVSALNGCFY